MTQRSGVYACMLILGLTLANPEDVTAAVDPVSTFIQDADSLARAGGDDLLTPYVIEHSILVGAVVARLLDVGFTAGDGGDQAGEKENLALAERIARLQNIQNKRGAPLELVATFESWTPEQRKIRKQAKAIEKQAAEARDAGDYDGALELYLRAKDLFSKIDDRYSVASIWGNIGMVQWYRGDMEAVKENYGKALVARRAIDHAILEGYTLVGLGGASIMTGEYDEAIGYLEQAIDLCRKTGDLTYLGTALNYLGATYYQMGNLVAARDAFEEALPVLEASGNPSKMAEVLINIASFYNEMGRPNRANDAYRRAIDIAVEVGQPRNEATSRINLADNLRSDGRFREALEQLVKVQDLLEGLNEPEKTVKFYRVRGFTYLDMGELAQARDDLLSCLEKSKPLSDPFYRIEALTNLAQLYLDLGSYEEGLEVAKKAKALAEASEKTRLVREAVVLAAEMHFAMAEYDEAMRLYEEALAMDREGGSEYYMLEEKIRMANVHAVEGDMSEARTLYNESIRTAREAGIDFERTYNLGMGHTYEDENPDSAIYYYERALDVVGRRRAALGGAETRTGFLSGKRRHIYEEVARYYASLDRPGEAGPGSDRAFHTIERAKARGLLDLLEAAALRKSDPVEEALLDSLYQITGETPEEKQTKQRLEDRYLARREERLPRSLASMRSRDDIVRVKDVQRALPRGTVLLEYALGDTTSLLWVIERKHHELHRLPNRAAVRDEVVRLRDAIARPGAGDAALRKTARSLYESLVGPAEHRVERAKRVVIIPDGVLFELPFEVLISKETDADEAWDAVPFLARSVPTAYAPSASVYIKLLHTKRRRKYPIEVLAAGNPECAMGGNTAGIEPSELAPLPNARSEIEAITAPLEDDKKLVLLGHEASESTLKHILARETPRILHLATHGLVDRADPAASCVVLCPDPASGEDGYLHTLEILDLPLDVGLVVLSACESGRGRVGRGEGVVGLSRAVVAAGAGGIVASLWAVSDKSTSELMKHFYERMLEGKRPALTALREARLALMDDPAYAHPFYWSPFVIIGSDRSPW